MLVKSFRSSCKLVHVSTSLTNLKIKEDDLEVSKLKTVSVDLKRLSDAVDKQVVENTKFLNRIDKKILKYKNDKQNYRS